MTELSRFDQIYEKLRTSPFNEANDILNEFGSDFINTSNHLGFTLLYAACVRTDDEEAYNICKKLISIGYDSSHVDKNGQTAIFWAAVCRNRVTVRYLAGLKIHFPKKMRFNRIDFPTLYLREIFYFLHSLDNYLS